LARIEIFYQQYHDERELEYAGYLFKAPGYPKPTAKIFNLSSHVPPPKHPLKPVVVPQRPSTLPQHPHDDDDFGFVTMVSLTYIYRFNITQRQMRHPLPLSMHWKRTSTHPKRTSTPLKRIFPMSLLLLAPMLLSSSESKLWSALPLKLPD
jgi:hypothetical protein